MSIKNHSHTVFQAQIIKARNAFAKWILTNVGGCWQWSVATRGSLIWLDNIDESTQSDRAVTVAECEKAEADGDFSHIFQMLKNCQIVND